MPQKLSGFVIIMTVTLAISICCITSLEPALNLIKTNTPTPQRIDTATPSPTTTPLPPEPTALPTKTPATTLQIGPFEKIMELDPQIFGPQPWLDAHLWDDPENNATHIEGLDGIVRILPDFVQTRIISDGYQLIGFDAAGCAYAIHKDDGVIHRFDLDWQSQPLPEGWQPVEDPESLNGIGVTTDFTGNIWLATWDDIRRFDGQKWTIWTRESLGMSPNLEEFISSMKVFSFDMLPGLWVTSCDYSGPGPFGGGGARWWDGTRWQGVGTPIETGCVTSIAQDSAGSFWIGVDHELWKFNSSSDNWQAHPYITAPEPYHRVYTQEIIISPQGIPWVIFDLCGGASCYNYQLAFYQDKNWQLVGEIAYSPQKLVFPQQGGPWLLDPYGIYRFENGDMVLKAEIFPVAGMIDQRDRLWVVAMDQDWVPALWMEIVE